MRGPIQPRLDCYPQKEAANGKRNFCVRWYDEFNWLEYSIEKDAAFCFYCRAFPQRGASTKGNSDPSFVSVGFSTWKKAVEKFRLHEKSQNHLSSIMCWNSYKKSKSVAELLDENHEQRVALREEKRKKKNKKFYSVLWTL